MKTKLLDANRVRRQFSFNYYANQAAKENKIETKNKG